MNEITDVMIQQIKEVDERDEKQILAELAGETIEDYIYEIVSYDKKAKKQKRTVKLSWAGTREMARYRGNITVSDPMITDQDGFLRIVVRATDLKRNFSIFGGCHQPKKMRVTVYDAEGKEIGAQEQDDPHYFTKALSKAQRNGLQAVIPADFTARMIDKFLIQLGREPIKQLPKPKVNHPRLNPAVAEPTDLKSLAELEIYAYNKWHIQPAEMYQQLSFKNRAECTLTPKDALNTLKTIYETKE